jgi:hypothetical protein
VQCGLTDPQYIPVTKNVARNPLVIDESTAGARRIRDEQTIAIGSKLAMDSRNVRIIQTGLR